MSGRIIRWPRRWPALHRESGVERLSLRGLGDDELLALLETTAGHEMTEDGVALRDALMAETEGNPFFVGEMLRHLAETQAIYPGRPGAMGGQSGPPDLGSAGQYPGSGRPAGGPARRRHPTGVVAGRGHRPRLRSRRAGPGGRSAAKTRVIDVCDQAVAAAVLTEAEMAGRYTFAHALIEHTLYDRLSAGRRARAHRRVADALEELCGDDPGERVGELAYHWAHATQPQDFDEGDRSTRNAPVTGRLRNSHPMRRCTGTGTRSTCSTGPRPMTRTARPPCYSGSAMPNDRPVIRLIVRPCSRRPISPTISTPSTSWYEPPCGTAEELPALSVRSTTSALRW